MDSINRDLLLSEGRVVGDFWFNEKSAQSFITLVTFSQVNKTPTVRWPNKHKEWVTLATVDAAKICGFIIKEMQTIYGGV